MNQDTRRMPLDVLHSFPVLIAEAVFVLAVWVSLVIWVYTAYGSVAGGVVVLGTAFPLALGHWSRTRRVVPLIVASVLPVIVVFLPVLLGG